MSIKSNVDKWADGQGPLDAIYHGDDKVWPIPRPTPRGMSKTSSQSLSGTGDIKLTGFTPQTGSTAADIVNNELVVNGTGNITVTASGFTFSGSMGGMRIYRNGVLVASSSSTATAPPALSWTGDVVLGDTLAVYANKVTTLSRTANAAGSLSYTVN